MKRILIVFLMLLTLPVFAVVNSQTSSADFALKIQMTKALKKAPEIFYHISKGDVQKVSELLKSGVNPNYKHMQVTPAFAAIYYNQNDILNLLLENGANPDSTSFGCTLLGFAISRGDENAVKSLINYGVNLNKQIFTYLPINYAINLDKTSIAKLLFEAGSKTNGKTRKLLKKSGNTELYNEFFEMGAE